MVRIAISEAAISSTISHFSTPLRARNWGAVWRSANQAPASETASATAPPISE